MWQGHYLLIVTYISHFFVITTVAKYLTKAALRVYQFEGYRPSWREGMLAGV